MTVTLRFLTRLTLLATLALALGAFGVPGAARAQSARPTVIMISMSE